MANSLRLTKIRRFSRLSVRPMGGTACKISPFQNWQGQRGPTTSSRYEVSFRPGLERTKERLAGRITRSGSRERTGIDAALADWLNDEQIRMSARYGDFWIAYG